MLISGKVLIFFLFDVENLNIITSVYFLVLEKSHCEFGMTGNVHPEAAVRVIQSMARFMAAYFANQLLYILPPHNVNVLPPLHFKTGIIVNNFLTLFLHIMFKIILYSDHYLVEIMFQLSV